ncbi:MAG: HAD hydrolase family protein [Phycisphaerae bacterium]|jgi:ribonucleotide monophosphatase NagD (HAD superfamily)
MIFAIDFDGTIVDYDFPYIGRVRDGAIETMTALQQAGHKIIIWTCRSNDSLTSMQLWLNNIGFKPDAINENVDPSLGYAHKKVYADVYIDDRSFPPFTGWGDIKGTYLSSKET